MKNDNFKKAIQNIRNLRMTTEEKSRIFSRIVSSETISAESINSRIPVRSWWNIYSLRTQISHKPWLVATVVTLLIIGGGNSLAVAAEGSVPGNILYPIKVSVIEPIRDNMTDTPQSVVEWEIVKVERRLVEAEKLAFEGKLTILQEEALATRIDTHAVKIKNVIERHSDDGAIDVENVEVAFEASLNAHVSILNEISSYVSNSENPEEVFIAQVARGHAEGVRLAKVDTTDVPAFATMSMMSSSLKIESDVSNSEITSAKVSAWQGNKKTDDNYQKVRIEAEKLIETTTKNIVAVGSSTSEFHKKIKDTSEKTLEKARRSIRDAEKYIESGDTDGAYGAVLESERSAKEATIILRDGLKVDAEKSSKEKKKNSKISPSEIKGERK